MDDTRSRQHSRDAYLQLTIALKDTWTQRFMLLFCSTYCNCSLIQFNLQTYQLFCGRDIPDGGVVTDDMFNSFIKNELDTLFDGYTISNVLGMWKGVPEITNCISICTDEYNKVLAVANAYKQLFAQDSVAIQTLAPMAFV